MIGSTSAFNESLVAAPNAEIQVSFPYGLLNTDIVTVTETDAGTVTASGQHALLETNGVGNAVLESKDVLRYGPGQGGLVRFACRFLNMSEFADQWVGVGDENDGYFIGFYRGVFSVMRRYGGESEITSMGNFDSIDTTSQRGNSLTWNVAKYDFSKGNVFQIRYQWLGYGAISFYVEDPSSGLFRLFHRIDYANKNVTTSINNPTLPMRVEVDGTASGQNASILISSFGAYIEGAPPRKIFTRNSFSSTVTSAVGEVALLTVRNKTTYNSLANRVTVVPDSATVSLDAGSSHRFRFLLNAALSGSSFGDVNTTNSVCDVDETASIFVGGKEIYSFTISGAGGVDIDLSRLELRLRPGDSLTVTVEKLAGAAQTCGASVSWRELH